MMPAPRHSDQPGAPDRRGSPHARLRIAHVTGTFPPYMAGTGNVCFYNARELARRGHEVHVFTSCGTNTPTREVIDGIAIHRLRPVVRLGNAPLLPQLLVSLGSFDLVHLHAPFISGAELSLIGARSRAVPLVVTYHNDLVPAGGWRDTVFRLATWSSRCVLAAADYLIFVSEGHATTSDMRALWSRGARRAVAPNGVDTHRFRPTVDRACVRRSLGLAEEGAIIGFVGGLDRAHHYKGLHVLFDALREEPLLNVRALVVGDGDMRARHERQTQDQGTSARVIFYGGARHDRLPSLYQACDVVAMPSLVHESFGLVALEALACGLPVVASDGPGIRSVVEDGKDGCLIAADDAPLLARAIADLLADDARRQAMGTHGRARVEACFDWSSIGDQLEEIYATVLRAPKGESRKR